MNIVEEYRRQAAWRPWPAILGALPPLEGQTVLDLGCGIGDLSAALAARGARVVGVDANAELLEAARSRGVPGARFFRGDLRDPLPLQEPVEGVWCSFAAAYFPDLAAVLPRWTRSLRPGGWIALTEIDDLFAHEPLSATTKALLEGYAEESLTAGRYDFRMGRRMQGILEDAGFRIAHSSTPEDQELAFPGPALPEVQEAWRRRLDRMVLLQQFCGREFAALRDEFLACLGRADHRSEARLVCCIAQR